MSEEEINHMFDSDSYLSIGILTTNTNNSKVLTNVAAEITVTEDMVIRNG